MRLRHEPLLPRIDLTINSADIDNIAAAAQVTQINAIADATRLTMENVSDIAAFIEPYVAVKLQEQAEKLYDIIKEQKEFDIRKEDFVKMLMSD